MSERVFGEIPDYPVHSWFESRKSLAAAGLHKPRIAGISGSEQDGADSIVLSGGYEDDEDLGDEIIYTGHGGRDDKTGKQIAHQKLRHGNLALAKSCVDGLPIRVIRGARHLSPHSPSTGYQYGGLYRVEDYWQERGRSGYYVWRYRLVKIAEDPETQTNFTSHVSEHSARYQAQPAARVETTVLRIIRNTTQARVVKEMYEYHCQVCDIRLEGNAGPYAEAAHIRSLGRPHNGADSLDNLLCLCPNHHVLFDHGAFSIHDDFTLLGLRGALKLTDGHYLDLANIQYHREHYFPQRED